MAKRRFKLSFQEYCLQTHKEALLRLYDREANELGPDEIPYSSGLQRHFRCPDCNGTWMANPNHMNRVKPSNWNYTLRKRQKTFCKFCKGCLLYTSRCV